MAEKGEIEEEKKIVFTSELVQETTDKLNDGVILKRFQNPWFQNETGVRRSGLTFMLTESEIQDYIRCKLDIHYFAEKYCKIKTEDGSVRNMTLRDYQKDILNLYTKNRFSILCASRQVGKCFVFNTIVQISDTKFERLGVLYYSILSTYRKLTFLEKMKIKMYDIIYRLDSNHKKF
jgi:hypothetical protein